MNLTTNRGVIRHRRGFLEQGGDTIPTNYSFDVYHGFANDIKCETIRIVQTRVQFFFVRVELMEK